MVQKAAQCKNAHGQSKAWAGSITGFVVPQCGKSAFPRQQQWAHTISSYSGMAPWPGLNLSDTAGREDAMNHGCHPDFRPVPR